MVRRSKILRTPGQDCPPLFRGNLMRQKNFIFNNWQFRNWIVGTRDVVKMHRGNSLWRI